MARDLYRAVHRRCQVAWPVCRRGAVSGFVIGVAAERPRLSGEVMIDSHVIPLLFDLVGISADKVLRAGRVRRGPEFTDFAGHGIDAIEWDHIVWKRIANHASAARVRARGE